MFKLKAKNKVCRKYIQDIWGNLLRKKKITNVIIYLLKLKKEKKLRYRPFFLDIKEPRPLKKRSIRSRFSKNLDTIKKISYYHGGLRKKKIKKYLTNSSFKEKKFITNFLSQLELRLAMIIFRMNICSTIFEANFLIYAGKVLVNKEVIKNINFIVKVGDIVELLNYVRLSKYTYYKSIRNLKGIFSVQPHFLQINYEILACFVLTKPNTKFMKYPFVVKKQFFYMLHKSKM